MRIHRLQIQAFGPFADRQEVDFDRLGSHGLFLLNGPTGAGKSSVLDAICYALYGSVPGVRQGAKRLRSDHAADGVAPEVACEFSVGGRRLEVIRNPQWHRPSKRGNGTTTEQARTLLRERIDGAWVQKSARNDEAGAELQDLLGMNAEQFTRVVMLPQGEFAAFLRSDAKSRRELLQKLFATDRFEQVEQELGERAKRLGMQLADAEADLVHLNRRAVDEVQRHATAPADASIGELDALLGAALGNAAAAATEASTEHTRLHQAHQKVAAALARQLALAAHRTAESLHLGQREEAENLSSAVDRHGMALVLHGSLLALDQAERNTRADGEAARATSLDVSASEVAMTLLAGEGLEVALLGSDDPGNVPDLGTTILGVDSVSSEVASLVGGLRSALPEEERWHSLEGRISSTTREREELEAALRSGAEALAAVRQEAVQVNGQLAELNRQVNEEDTLHARVTEAHQALENFTALDAAKARAEQEHSHYVATERRYLDLKSVWLETLRQRLEQAAAELAAQLAEGADCPVCGSPDHPRPASAEEGSLITHDQEQTAEQAQESAGQELDRVRQRRDDADLDVARLEARCGDRETDAVQEELALASAALEAVAGARRTLAETTEYLAGLVAREQALVDAQSEDSTALAGLRSLISSLLEQQEELRDRLVSLRDGYDSLAQRISTLEEAKRALVAWRETLQRLQHSTEAHERAAAALDDALIGSAFADPEEVRAALLAPAELAGAKDFLTRYQRAGQRLEEDRDLPEIATALLDEEAGVPAVTQDQVVEADAAEQTSAEKVAKATLALGMIEESVLQLERYATEFATREHTIVPLREQHHLLKSLAETAVGSGDNSYKMSLATYVLAARLEQVADAATERLLAMSDGRYALVHSDALSGNRKSGLGLNVVDGWTGNTRDTATLSGGESFMAALALALGLADVVQAESGGIDIETLFVDEGFGSLDEQSLEQVMDALEGLRDGGRMVGLVSHVGELKQRISAQLQVTKGRNGSTLRILDQVPGEQLAGDRQAV